MLLHLCRLTRVPTLSLTTIVSTPVSAASV